MWSQLKQQLDNLTSQVGLWVQGLQQEIQATAAGAATALASAVAGLFVNQIALNGTVLPLNGGVSNVTFNGLTVKMPAAAQAGTTWLIKTSGQAITLTTDTGVPTVYYPGGNATSIALPQYAAYQALRIVAQAGSFRVSAVMMTAENSSGVYGSGVSGQLNFLLGYPMVAVPWSVSPGGTGIVLASGANIAPTSYIQHVSGTATITSVTPPSWLSAGQGFDCWLIADAAFGWNLTNSGTATAGKVYHLVYDGAATYIT